MPCQGNGRWDWIGFIRPIDGVESAVNLFIVAGSSIT